MTRVKICGITEVDQAIAAAQAGADYLGMVFASSRRRINPAKAFLMRQAISDMLSRPEMAGVFVNTPCHEVNLIASQCGLDWVQLSGDETWEYCHNIESPVIKTIYVLPDHTAYDILQTIEAGYKSLAQHRLICLLDSRAMGAYGGSGRTFDWSLAATVSSVFPVMIAGGLTTRNIADLIKQVQPWGVDISSGVETDGTKDQTKIIDFMRTVRSLDRSLQE